MSSYKLLSKITDIERIARGPSVQIRHYLNETFGQGAWRKLKGKAVVEYTDGQVWLVELHWFEAHGIGRRLEKDKYRLRRHK